VELVLKVKYFGKGKDWNVKISQANYIVGLFKKRLQPIKRGWIYNLQYWGNSELTQGTEERQEFAIHYGAISKWLLDCWGQGQILTITNWASIYL
jgi:hypothetical protein